MEEKKERKWRGTVRERRAKGARKGGVREKDIEREGEEKGDGGEN